MLEKDYHLSYPFTFEWRGAHYMIPETAAHGAVELYKGVEFPFKWEMEKTLLKGVNATDATLVEADGLWWMFVNVGERDYPTDWNGLPITPTARWGTGSRTKPTPSKRT